MVLQLKKIKYHLVFWGVVLISISLVFGHSWGNIFAAFTYVAILTPIVIGVVYLFNFYLVPRYLITHQYFKFLLYSCLTVAISLLLESYLIVFSFILLGHFDFHKVAPNASDTILLFVVLYLFVFATSTFILFKHLSLANQKIDIYDEKQKNESKVLLEVISNRKKVNIQFDTILYIESLSDYIIIHTTKKEYQSKERISKIQKRLPQSFIRIHRSFIVNKENIFSYASNYITINDKDLPIGRSYRQDIKHLL